MTDNNHPRITPKRVVLGVLALIALTLLYSLFQTLLFPQLSLGLRGNINSASAPAMYQVTTSGMTQGAVGALEMANDNALVAPGSPTPVLPPSPPPAGEAKIVKNGSLTLVVDDVTAAADDITAIRMRLGGQPGNATFREYQRGVRTGFITIWVPSEQFDAALVAIKKLALQVQDESVNVSDVSAQYVDLTARLKNLHAAETQYLAIMQRSGKISDVLDVTRELNNTRAQIEQTQGQLDYLAHQVALSSIAVTLTEEATPSAATNEWHPLAVVKEALKSTLNDLTNFVDLLLVFIVKLPVLIVYIAFWLLILLGLWKGAQALHRRLLRMTSSGSK